jgi:hypothetical protein
MPNIEERRALEYYAQNRSILGRAEFGARICIKGKYLCARGEIRVFLEALGNVMGY